MVLIFGIGHQFLGTPVGIIRGRYRAEKVAFWKIQKSNMLCKIEFFLHKKWAQILECLPQKQDFFASRATDETTT